MNLFIEIIAHNCKHWVKVLQNLDIFYKSLVCPAISSIFDFKCTNISKRSITPEKELLI